MTMRHLPSLAGGAGTTLLLFLSLSLLATGHAPSPLPAYPDAVSLAQTPPELMDSRELVSEEPVAAIAPPSPLPALPSAPDLPVPAMPSVMPPALIAPQGVALDLALPVGQADGNKDADLGIYDEAHVDELPRAVSKTPPEYPYAAQRRGISGVVVLRLVVETDGSVGLVEVVSARPTGVFENSARLAVSQWRFAPGMRQGRPVRTWVRLPVTFSME